MSEGPWGLRPAPELATPAEAGNVWLLTFEGEDVVGADVFGEGFARAVVDDLNARAKNPLV